MSQGNGTPVSPDALQRVPPHDLEAEVCVLGSMLLDESVVREVVALLHAEDFYREGHRRMFASMLALHEAASPIDAVLLREDLRQRGDLDAAGGPEAIVNLLDRVPTPAHALHYAKIVAEAAARRRLILFFSKGADAAFTGSHDPQDIVQKAQAALVRFASESLSFARVRKFKSVADLLASQAERTPWLVDGIVSEGAVTVVAGLPKGGKSTMIYSLLANLERGEPWCDCPVENPATAVVLSEESPHHIAQKCQRFGVERAYFLDKTDMFPQRPMAESVDFAIAKAREVGAKLILVDTYARWAGLGPDGEKDAGTVQESLVPLMKAAAEGFAVILIHHHKKAEGDQGTQLRGSGALLADVEHLVEVRRLKDNLASPFREVAVLSRDPTAPEEPFVVELGARSYRRAGALVDIQHSMTEGRILGALANAAGRRLTREELAEAVGGKATGFGVALKRLMEPKDGPPRVDRTGEGKRKSPHLYGLVGGGPLVALPGPAGAPTPKSSGASSPPGPAEAASVPLPALFPEPPPEPREDGPALPPEGDPEALASPVVDLEWPDPVQGEESGPEPDAGDPLAEFLDGPAPAPEGAAALVQGGGGGPEPDPLDDLLGPAG